MNIIQLRQRGYFAGQFLLEDDQHTYPLGNCLTLVRTGEPSPFCTSLWPDFIPIEWRTWIHTPVVVCVITGPLGEALPGEAIVQALKTQLINRVLEEVPIGKRVTICASPRYAEQIKRHYYLPEIVGT